MVFRSICSDWGIQMNRRIIRRDGRSGRVSRHNSDVQQRLVPTSGIRPLTGALPARSGGARPRTCPPAYYRSRYKRSRRSSNSSSVRSPGQRRLSVPRVRGPSVARWTGEPRCTRDIRGRESPCPSTPRRGDGTSQETSPAGLPVRAKRSRGTQESR
ncbi:cir-1; CIR (transcription factor CBF1 Interacting coRepressor)-like; K06066 CBF1 interacting corepressor (plasmid) [Haloterrigena turkmenica DSM 5511]|uniref:Cir-1 CIR (Transcription factor CBF1 Interacting coRepressor)-like K06066 CBF1 interacting corepressor n=1 Tax=Haloterrigena turkmenica (strain ATCC 51198 / DSM 5511 / JCM 9101 / NCIMB 13204 / VKM B-1734 / 4k) TaxID=543526 RepID=D2S2G8_HALTV|nr:cir-1; CIR (transcription factor CBF1 Interacting coRepressor)-like; K06066 CBF1 interacting corepressor [Haloterrigena turkmenica DSM 5511]